MQISNNILYQEWLALKDIFEEIKFLGHLNWLFDNYTKRNPCIDNWQGITCACYNDGCHVSNITLRLISGKLPESISNLIQLQTLSLSTINQNCDITCDCGLSHIPNTLQQLANLVYLDLSGNSDFFCNLGNVSMILNTLTNLSHLDLADNGIFNTIDEFTTLFPSRLQYLDLNHNMFYGTLPSFAGLYNLSYIDLSYNDFTGLIPSYETLKNIESFSLDRNYLINGTIPLFGFESSLQFLSLSYTSLTGFSSNINANSFKNLVKIRIINSLIMDLIPAFLVNSIHLTYIEISYNFLYGPIPDLSNLVNLQYLIFYSNLLSGSIPNFSNNQLYYLFLSYNFLNSTIPDFNVLENLNSLGLDNNKLTGSFPALDRNKKLENIFLSVNNLVGYLPDSISDPDVLIALIVGSNQQLVPGDIENQVYGMIPSTYCSYKKLQVLILPVPFQNTSTQPFKTNSCYPSCIYSVLNQIYSLNNDRCPGGEDIAICKLLTIADVSNTLQENLVVQNAVIDSIHPLGPDPYTYQGTISYLNVVYYEIKLYDKCGLPPGTFIAITPNNITITCNDIGEVFKISSDSFTIEYKQPGYSRYRVDLFFFGFQLIVTAYTYPYIGWQSCSTYNATAITMPGTSLPQPLPTTSIAENLCYWTGITCNAQQITKIDLSGYGLTGWIPSSLTFITSLTELNLGNNFFWGTIPFNIGSLTKLEYLYLSGNLLEGEIPSSISTMKSLISIQLSRNRLTGTLPFIPASSSASVTYNYLIGQIPAAICEYSAQHSTKYSLNGNTGLQCYVPCSGNNTLEIYNPGLYPCSPTAIPTVAPSISSISNEVSNRDAVVIGSIVGGVSFLIMLLIGVWYRRKMAVYKKIEAEEMHKNTEKLEILKHLPVHKLLIDNCRNNVANDNKLENLILKNITEYSDTLHKLDFDENAAIDLALKFYSFMQSDRIILEILRKCLPCYRKHNVEEVGFVDPTEHNYAWIKVVTSPYSLTNIVEQILTENSLLCQELSESKDILGRSALNAAIPDCKRVILESIYFFKRYEITTKTPHHQSATCILHLAIDHRAKTEQEKYVALKFMDCKEKFNCEILTRSKGNFDKRYVMEIFHYHDSDLDSEFMKALTHRGLSSYPYMIVMPMGHRDLQVLIVKENLDQQTIRSFVLKIAKCLQHMHEQGYIHGDLKPANIIQANNNSLLLIDLDGSAAIGKDFSGMKVSTAYSPPELIHYCPNRLEYLPKLFLSSFAINNTNSNKDTNVVPDYEYLLADPAQDSWSLGIILFFIATGHLLFFADKNDCIYNKDIYKCLYEFSIEFKHSELATIQDTQLKNLISQLLNKNPKKRLNMNQVLVHPFLTGKIPYRMVGEQPEYDVFISYRVASDSKHVECIYNQLTKAGLKVWWDVKCLKFGKDWEEGFIDGLLKSRVFLPIFSRNAINDPHNSRCNITKLSQDSPIDNFLLEQRLALELFKRDLIELISPVMIGDLDVENMVYSNYFSSNCHPSLNIVSTTIITKIETRVIEELDKQSLGLPLFTNMSIKDIIDKILKNQGCFIEGSKQEAFDKVIQQILKGVNFKTYDR